MKKTIKGFENYTISKKGVVRNEKTNTIRKETSNNSGKGYLYVDLYKNNKKSRKYIHRLVAETFIPNPENKPMVNHKDGNTKNNNISNLEWVTAKENVEHASKILNVMKGYAIACEKKKKKVFVFDYFSDCLLYEFNSLSECSKYTGIKVCNIIENYKSKYKTKLKGLYFSTDKDTAKLKPRKRHVRDDISAFKVFKLKKEGNSNKYIANMFKCSEGVISRKLRMFVEELGDDYE